MQLDARVGIAFCKAVGRTEQPWYKQALGLTVTQRRLRHGRGFDSHLLDSQEPSP